MVRHKRIPWTRLSFTTIGLLLIIFCMALVVYGNNPSTVDIALALLAGISAILVLGQWIFPWNWEKSKQLIHPYVYELDRGSFGMGDDTAAKFDYITTPIQDAYNTTTQALLDACTGAGHKRGILIYGEANTGKTRLAFEALTQTVPSWPVLRWRPHYIIDIDDTPTDIVSKQGLVVFIDDLQNYLPPEIKDTGRQVPPTYSKEAETLRTFLGTLIQAAPRIIIVATYRTEYRQRIQIVFDWLLDQLEEITLPSFNPNPQDLESVKIITEFQEHGIVHIGDWDGTLGSLVLGLSKKKSQYGTLPSCAVLVLRAMKLLKLVNIAVHTETLLRAVCSDVFGEKTFLEDELKWQDAIDRLIQMQFVTEEIDKDSREVTFVIRNDVYYDQVITDYPMLNRPHQHEGHLVRLQDVFVVLKDTDALINRSIALIKLNRYKESLTGIEQAIHLDPNEALAYIFKGYILTELKQYEEALTVYEQAIHLAHGFAYVYLLKGDTFAKLKRFEEALEAYEQAIRLDSNFALAYHNKGRALIELKRYRDALEAIEQAIHLDLNHASGYVVKGIALIGLERFEEALDAFEQAIRLDPKEPTAYYNKGVILATLKQDRPALLAYEQTIRLDPNFAPAYYNKAVTLIGLKRYKEALASLEQAIHLTPHKAIIYSNKGVALIGLKRYKEALASLEQAIHLDPNAFSAYVNKGSTLLELKQYEEALAAYDHALVLEPNIVEVWQNKADVLRILRRKEEAKAAEVRAEELRN